MELIIIFKNVSARHGKFYNLHNLLITHKSYNSNHHNYTASKISKKIQLLSARSCPRMTKMEGFIFNDNDDELRTDTYAQSCKEIRAVIVIKKTNY